MDGPKDPNNACPGLAELAGHEHLRLPRRLVSHVFFSTITYAPIVFILTTVGWYVTPRAFPTRWASRDAFWLGAISGAVLCSVYGVAWWLVSKAAQYEETPEIVAIIERWHVLRRRVVAIAGSWSNNGLDQDLCELIECLLAVERHVRLKSSLPRPLYVLTLWRLLHAAEEALIPLDELPIVLEGALNDELRLEGSTIDSTNQLLLRLRRAVQTLSPEAAAYLDQQPPARCGPATGTRAGGSAVVAGPTPPSGQTTLEDCAEASRCTQARLMLRQVCRAINEFRDSRRGSLIVAAHNLRLVTGWSAFFTYILLGFCIAANARVNVLIAVLVLYLVGAVVGLFKRLSAEISAKSTNEDHGLFGARLVVTPLLSGLAAVGGVVLTIMVYSAAAGAPAIPKLPAATATAVNVAAAADRSQRIGEPPAATTATDAEARLPSLNDVFDLDQFPFALILAAAFGLTPNLLISGLQTQTAKLRSDLQSSEAPEKSPS